MKSSVWVRPSLNWLLVFVPVGVALKATGASPTAVFVTSCLAIVPLAGWMGKATEHLSEKVGAGVGGLLNATFGNAAELIIAALFLLEARGHPEKLAESHGVVKASLTGSIIGNLLLVLGASLLAGGLRFPVQQFNATAARTGATMLFLAAISLIVPAGFALLMHGKQGRANVGDLSLEIAILLIVIYALSLVFALKTHKHLYLGEVGEEAARLEEEEQPAHRWPLARSVVILLVSAALVGLMSELLVSSVDQAAEALHMPKLFIGIVVIAIIGNAAEHSTAILMAMRNHMDLSLGIAIGSSIQIALFVAPVLILLSYALGQPMNLVFELSEVLAVVLSVAVVSQIAGDGESNWLEGVQLLSVYAMLAVLFYYLG
jgi:Ca2+:H+ antiporter